MPDLLLDLVSQDRMVFSGAIAEVIAPGIEGQLAVLPRHAPLLTILKPGEVVVTRPDGELVSYAVSGGWMEVRPDKVTILARSAERSDEIDQERAKAARERARQLLAQGVPRQDRAGVELVLKRSLTRLKVARKRGWRVPDGSGPGPGGAPQ